MDTPLLIKKAITFDHEHSNLFEQLTEILGAGFLAAHKGKLMLDERMINYVYF